MTKPQRWSHTLKGEREGRERRKGEKDRRKGRERKGGREGWERREGVLFTKKKQTFDTLWFRLVSLTVFTLHLVLVFEVFLFPLADYILARNTALKQRIKDMYTYGPINFFICCAPPKCDKHSIEVQLHFFTVFGHIFYILFALAVPVVCQDLPLF